MKHLFLIVAAWVAVMGAAGGEPAAPDGCLPYDSRWDHPHYLTWRPANGATAAVNPPRFSWPAVPEIVTGRDEPPLREHILQLAREGDFARPDHEFRTHYNFFNALPALAPGRWSWRVVYRDGDQAIHASAVRWFGVARDVPVWERTVIDCAAARLAALPRPRLGPPSDDWMAWRKQLEADAETARWLSDLGSGARKLRRNAWWEFFPATDRKGETEFDDQDFANAALGLTRALLAWKLTGDAARICRPPEFRYLARMTGDGRCETRRRALEAETGGRLSPRPWLDLAAALRLPYPEPTPEAATAVFPEAGWVMASSRTPSDRDGFADATGMIFQCRPRGGFSHSYRAENSFVWHAFGQSLSAGGGGTAYPDPHSRHSLSHNVMLIRGIGQEWDSRTPARPLCGRLLAWRKGQEHVYWAGDATHAYQTVPDLVRWHRHVVFVDKRWFVLLDDLALTPEAEPATFSWLYHVAPKVPVEIDAIGAGFRYAMEGVHARVLFAKKGSELQIANLRGRDGFRNPLTGIDLYDETVKAVGGKDRPLRDDQILIATTG